MKFSEYLDHEWVRALGCTEPASIALAAALAASEVKGELKRITLKVDPRIYKNCYAVGIPHSGHKIGIKWAGAIGAYIEDPSSGLECFKSVTDKILKNAANIINKDLIDVHVDSSKADLFIDCSIEKTKGCARAVILGDHTNIVRLERNGRKIIDKPQVGHSGKSLFRKKIALMPLSKLMTMARTVSARDRKRLREGIALNKEIARHGLGLFPKSFVELGKEEFLTAISKRVCAGVYARMWGEDFPVMSLAGSGNKGIVVSVSLSLHGENIGASERSIEEALALACLITTATTFELGTLSAVCGCSNAAGIGLAAGIVKMEGGGEKEISLAINNMVGNVTGMICDGAKIGCALKTMTAVDSAFRAAALALAGIGIPSSDGIVGSTGQKSLKNMGRIAMRGMVSADEEILAIMQEKLKKMHPCRGREY